MVKFTAAPPPESRREAGDANRETTSGPRALPEGLADRSLPANNTRFLAGSPLKNKTPKRQRYPNTYSGGGEACRQRAASATETQSYFCSPRNEPCSTAGRHGAARQGRRRGAGAGAQAGAYSKDAGHGGTQGRVARPESQKTPGDAAGLFVPVRDDFVGGLDFSVETQPHLVVRARVQSS